MRSSTPILVICLGAVLAAAQSSAPSVPAAPAPQAPASAQKSGSNPSPAAKTAPKQPAAESKEVSPDAAVITIKGLCAKSAAKPAASKTASAAKPAATASKAAACETVITRKQLELLIETVRPQLQPAQRRALAQQYAELLIMSTAAMNAGTEKEPKVQEQIRLSKLQIVANAYSREIQQKESEVPPADIETYYKEHADKYEEAKLQRIYIPLVSEEGKPPDTAATKVLAEKIQQRAAAGEDFDKLQKEAFANSKGTAPSTDLGERRRGTLPPKQEEAVFALKPGDVSPALEEGSGFYIYKLVSKEEIPLDKVGDEIKSALSRERSREAVEKLRTSVQPTFNDAYFGPATPAPTGELGGGRPAPPAPAAAPRQPSAPATAPDAPKTAPPAPPSDK